MLLLFQGSTRAIWAALSELANVHPQAPTRCFIVESSEQKQQFINVMRDDLLRVGVELVNNVQEDVYPYLQSAPVRSPPSCYIPCS